MIFDGMGYFASVTSLLAVALALTYYYATRNFSHWKKKGVEYVQPYPFIGSLWKIVSRQEHMSDFFLNLARKFKGLKFVGYFIGSCPGLMVMDPELIKMIVIKDFSHFGDRGVNVDEKLNPLQAKNLVLMTGQRWKDMRNMLSPTFTSGKMKNMFPLLADCAKNLEQCLYGIEGDDIEIKDLMARYTTDVIGNSVFGIQTNSIENQNDQFRVMGRKLFENFGIKSAIIFFLPKIARLLKLKLMPDDISEYFRGIVLNILDSRSKTGKIRQDFIQLLIRLKETGTLGKEDDKKIDEQSSKRTHFKLTDDDIIAQALVFFFAGFETSSSTLTFGLMEIARFPQVQQKARENIEQVLARHNGVMSYQALQEMTYLELIMQETLRMYPPLSVLQRVCTKKYKIPDTNVTIDEGTIIAIPIRALQTDSKYFESPDVFNPDRFEDTEKIHENQFVHMPFGEGPRQCIGMRFAKMETKLGLYSILRNFEVLESPRTVYPPIWDTKPPTLLSSKHDIYVKLRKCQK